MKQKKVNTNFAIIRELHVYGQALKLGEIGKISQHMGFGRLLLKEAEEIVKENKINELKVIAGVGVREYYKRLGYRLGKEGEYLVRKI